MLFKKRKLKKMQSLMWIASTDLYMWGKLTEETIQCFRAQKIALPDEFKQYI